MVKPKKTEQWLRCRIPVPALLPTNLGYCNIVFVKYYVVVSTVYNAITVHLSVTLYIPFRAKVDTNVEMQYFLFFVIVMQEFKFYDVVVSQKR